MPLTVIKVVEDIVKQVENTVTDIANEVSNSAQQAAFDALVAEHNNIKKAYEDEIAKIKMILENRLTESIKSTLSPRSSDIQKEIDLKEAQINSLMTEANPTIPAESKKNDKKKDVKKPIKSTVGGLARNCK